MLFANENNDFHQSLCRLWNKQQNVMQLLILSLKLQIIQIYNQQY